MRESLDGLLRDLTLVTLALAIALGWALFQVAQGVAEFVSAALIDYPHEPGILDSIRYSNALTWVVHDHILSFGPLVEGLVELAVVLAVAAVVYPRFHTDSPQDTAEPSQES